MTAMPPYTIRPATSADAGTIKQMVRSESLDPNAIDWRYFLVLELIADGVPLIACIAMVRPVEDFHELDSVTTLPAYRGRGYASALVRAWLERARQESLLPIYLLSETDLIGFYERLGFQRIAETSAPEAMRDQAAFVNSLFRGRVVYHIMGTAGTTDKAGDV